MMPLVIATGEAEITAVVRCPGDEASATDFHNHLKIYVVGKGDGVDFALNGMTAYARTIGS